MSISAGQLRYPIAFQSAALASNTTGEPTKTWSTTFTRRGWIRPLSGRELLNAQAVTAEATTLITVRYAASQLITADMRAQYNGVTYDINFVGETDLLHAELKLYCKEAA